ncbi:hypothetical protein TSUD_203910 [Trifolium subterraneum]|uniref:Uncharacterized protein n=1 Tax=Trifolium subterraneum TaxID=3900 RepID=A0A2Z6LWK1_TRISU|nr:hypothetical protein TSUD_203910 [Trifolium subterraneum]
MEKEKINPRNGAEETVQIQETGMKILRDERARASTLKKKVERRARLRLRKKKFIVFGVKKMILERTKKMKGESMWMDVFQVVVIF